MKWENLNSEACPYCDNKLVDRDGEMRCVSCTFHIDKVRYTAIRKHRSQLTDGSPKMKWQNVVDMLCPICASNLRDSEGKNGMQRCSNAHCTFKISDDMLGAILKDPNHPANRYHEVEQQ